MSDRRLERLNQRRRLLALSPADCWSAYFALGGHASPDQVADYLQGQAELPEGEVDILAAALDEHRLPGTGLSAGSPMLRLSHLDRAAAYADTLAAWIQAIAAPTAATALSPFSLSEVYVAVRSQPASTQLEPFARASLPSGRGPGSVLRVDAADHQCWEVHHSGPEVLVLLAGAVAIALAGDGANPDPQPRQTATLTHQQQALVVPKGTWHQHRATRPGTALLYLTPTGNSATASAAP